MEQQVGTAQVDGRAATHSPALPAPAGAPEPTADASNREAASMEPQQRGDEAPAAAEGSGVVVVRALRQGAEENRVVREVWISGYRSYTENPCREAPDGAEGGLAAWLGGGWGGCCCAEHGERMVAGFCARWAPDMDDIWGSHLAPGRGGTFLLAECAGEIVGCVGGMPHDPLTLELHRMSVLGGQHRRGVGRRLVAELEAWARRNGFAQIFLTTWAGHCRGTRKPGVFYEKLGFQLVQHDRPRVYLKVLAPEVIAAARAAQATAGADGGPDGDDAGASDHGSGDGESSSGGEEAFHAEEGRVAG